MRRVDLANWVLRTSPKFTTGVKYQSHQGFWTDQRSGNPNHPSPSIKHKWFRSFFEVDLHILKIIWFLNNIFCVSHLSFHVLYSCCEMAVGVDRRDGGTSRYILTWKLLSAYLAPEKYWYTCSKCLWNRNTALNSAVNMRDYFPSIPSTYYSSHIMAWQ